ncbi:MAG: hypothetical protein JOZ05_03275 [Acetobacteraceae bacterium]|nr:hypothetical protein [Acetobacteraceae bacterium]
MDANYIRKSGVLGKPSCLSAERAVDEPLEQRRKSPIGLHPRRQALQDCATACQIQPGADDAQPGTLLGNRPEGLIAEQPGARRMAGKGLSINGSHTRLLAWPSHVERGKGSDRQNRCRDMRS